MTKGYNIRDNTLSDMPKTKIRRKFAANQQKYKVKLAEIILNPPLNMPKLADLLSIEPKTDKSH